MNRRQNPSQSSPGGKASRRFKRTVWITPLVALLAGGLDVAPKGAYAATFFWDPGTTPTTPSGGAGTWGTASNWSNSTVDSAWVFGAETNIASFGGTPGTGAVLVNRSGATTKVDGLEFTVGGYTLTSNVAGDTITFSGPNAINLTNAILSGDTTINSALVLSAAGTFTNNGAGNLFINGGVTGSGSGLTIDGSGNTTFGTTAIGTVAGTLTKNGAGTLTLNFANTFTGLTTVNTGTLSYGVNNALSSGGVTINGAGQMNLGGFTDTVGAITINSTGATTDTTAIQATTNGALTTTGAVSITPVAGHLTKIDMSSGGPLTLPSSNSVTFNAATTGQAQITGTNPLALVGVNVFNIGAGTSGSYDLDINGIISGGALTKSTGTGVLQFSGSTSNTYIGATIVSAGTLNLNKTGSAEAVSGSSLVVNNGASVAYTGNSSDMIKDAATVTLNGTGSLNTSSNNDTFGGVTIAASGATANTTPLQGTGALTIGTLGITPVAGFLSQINMGTTGSLTLGNSVTFTAATTGQAQIIGTNSGASGTLALGANPRSFAIAAGSSGSYDLDISGIISGSGDALGKSGAGVLQFSGSTSNTYSGLTSVTVGTLNLNKSGSAQAIANNGLTVSSGASTIYTGNSSDMMGTGTVTINGTGTLNTSSNSDTIGNVSIVATGAAANTTPLQGTGAITIGTLGFTPVAGFLSTINMGSTGSLILGGNVTFTAATTGQASITGTKAAGTLDLGGATRTFTVAAGTSGTYDLQIAGGITDGNLTKAGAGILLISADNTNYSGATAIQGGTLRVTQTDGLNTSGVTFNTAAGIFDLENNGTGSNGSITYSNNITDSISGSTINVGNGGGGNTGNMVNLGTLSVTGTDTLNVTGSNGYNVTLGAVSLTGNPTFNPTTANLTIGALNDNGTLRTITKTGADTLVLGAAAATVTTGELLTINTGTVQENVANALGASGIVGVTVNGTTVSTTTAFNLNGVNQSILSLTFGGTTATSTSTNTVSTGGGTLTVGNITYTTTNNPLASTITGNLNVSGAAVYNIATSTNASIPLDIIGVMGGAGTIAKSTGTGTLQFSGSGSNNTGLVTINAGTLNLNKGGTDNAIGSSGLTIATAGTATYTGASTDMISDSAPVAVNGNGVLNLNGVNDTIGSLSFTAIATDLASVNLGGGTLTVNGASNIAFTAATTGQAQVNGTLNASGGNGSRAFAVGLGTGIGYDLDINGVLTGAGLSTASTATGRLRLSGTTANTYTGTFTVNGGTLVLNKTAALGSGGAAIISDLAIGDSSGLDIVQLAASDQIADASNVTINSSGASGVSGQLGLGTFNETINNLTITKTTSNEAAVLSTSGNLTVNGTLSITAGSTVDATGNISMGSGTLTLGSGGISATGSATVNQDATIVGSVALNGNQMITVAAGNALNVFDLNINGTISGSGSNTLTTAGTGQLELSGTAANTYGGATTVNSGTLVLNKTANLGPNGGAIQNGLNIGDGTGAAGSAIVETIASEQIDNSLTINIVSDGLLQIGNAGNLVTETIGPLNLTGGSVNYGAASHASTVILNGDVTTNASSQTASIAPAGNSTTAGTVDLGSTTRTFTVADGGAAIDLILSGKITSTSFGIFKNGPGTMQMGLPGVAGASTFTGGVTLNAGTLILASNGTATGVLGTGALALNGGLLTASTTAENFNNAVSIGADTTIGATDGSANTLTLTGDVTLTGSRTITVSDGTAATDLAIGTSAGNGFIDDGGHGYGLTKLGAGTLLFQGTQSNTYTGVTNVYAGTLAITKTSSATAIQGDVVVGDPSNSGINAVLIVSGADQLTTTSHVTVNANGLLQYNARDNSVGIGALTMTGSQMQMTNTGGTTTRVFLNGDVTTNASNTEADVVTVETGGSQASSLVGLVGTRTFNIADGGAATDLGLSVDLIGTGGIIKTGAGTLELGSGPFPAVGGNGSTYSGGTVLQNGTIMINYSSVPLSHAGVGDGPLGIGTLTLTAGTLMSGGTADNTLNNVVQFGAGGVVELRANNGADLIFDTADEGDAGTHTFPHVPTGVTLKINQGSVTGGVGSGGAVQINGTSLTVDLGGILGGSGILRVGSAGTGSVVINGTVSPGNSPGTLTLESTLDLNGQYHWELASLLDNSGGTAGSDWDLLDVTGAADVTGASLTFGFGAGMDPNSNNIFWTSSHVWTILNSGGLTGTLSTPGGFTDGSFLTQASGSSLELLWTPSEVPEPASFVLLALGGLLVFGRHRKA